MKRDKEREGRREEYKKDTERRKTKRRVLQLVADRSQFYVEARAARERRERGRE